MKRPPCSRASLRPVASRDARRGNRRPSSRVEPWPETAKVAPVRARLIVSLAVSVMALAACGPEPREAPTDSDEVQERALEAQTARRRTGAEIQERILTRTVRAVYLCNNGERLSVDFDNARQMATVRQVSGKAVDLRQQRASEGIWY